MDKSKCREVVDQYIKPMMNLLGVQAWDVTVLYVPPPQDPRWMAACSRNPPYQRATIWIDPERHDTEEEVLNSLRHELIHVVLNPFDTYRGIMTCDIDKGSTIDRIEDEAWTMAVENAVLAIERIFDWGLKAKLATIKDAMTFPTPAEPAPDSSSTTDSPV